ncbi:LAETG motif-containing sortase-dependent surface protein [Streptomyces sp. NBC_01477]|uniref:LAETG motif-containing sortase-dependent surface protein n=1 Tax=Streptomyces sp. NBC_01477 TaxID=2976015 RepID=UPI003FCE39A1
MTQTTPTTGNLAETGAGFATRYLALGAAGLVAAGAAACLLTARRRRTGTAAEPRG